MPRALAGQHWPVPGPRGGNSSSLTQLEAGGCLAASTLPVCPAVLKPLIPRLNAIWFQIQLTVFLGEAQGVQMGPIFIFAETKT